MSRETNRLSFVPLLLAGFRLLRGDLPRLIGVAGLLPAGLTLLEAATVPLSGRLGLPGIPIGIPIGRPGGLVMGALEVAGNLTLAAPFVPVEAALAVVVGLYDLAAALASRPIASLPWELLALLIGLLRFTVQLFATPLIWAAVIAAAGDVHSGRRASAWQAFRTGWSIMLPLVRTSVLFCVCLALYAALVSASSLSYPSLQPPLALILSACGTLGTLPFVIVLPVMVFERRFGWEPFRMSYHLMRGNLLRGAGAVIASGFMGQVLNERLAEGHGAFLSLLALVLFAVWIAYTSSVLVVLYRDTRGGDAAAC